MSVPGIATHFVRAARIASAAVAVLGGAVCAGWLLAIPGLVRLHPALASMKLNTALALTALGVALRRSTTRPASRLPRVLALAVAGLAAATLLEYAGVELGIDELIVRDFTRSDVPGRMAPATAVMLAGLGLAVGLRSRRAVWLAVLAAVAAHVALLGYLYGVSDLYAVGPYASVAVHTALGVYALALAVFAARPDGRMLRIAVSDSASGVLLRRLAPAALVVPALLALVCQGGEQAGLYGPGFGRAMLVASNSLAFLLLIAWTATAIGRADELRHTAEHRLRTLAAVSDAFAAVATAPQPLLDEIARTVADIVGDGCLVTLISDDGDQMYNAANAHRNPALEADYKTYVAELSLTTLTSSSVSATVARTGQPARADIVPDEMVARSEDALKPLVARLAVHGYAVVPIRARGTVIGTLSVLRSAPGRPYTDQDVTLLSDLADRAGLAIENARLYAQLEQRVHERTAELEAANRELEAFSSSVAHDLRAPLRAVAGFSEALLEDAADRLAPDDVRHATQIRDAARRMGDLIAALLELARIGRTEPHRRRVDVSELARTIIARLRTAQPERDVEVEIGDGLIAFADPRLVEIALTNLLGNAWKFTARRARARIELAAMPGGAPPVYVVSDNGAGFDPAHAGQLFGVFQRLHAASDFEGTGVGLATVQRIVARHGGTIWAEAEPDRGAAFYFTLQAPVTGRAASRRSPS